MASTMLHEKCCNTVLQIGAPPSQGEKMSKRLGVIKGCKYKTSSWHLNGFPYMIVTLGQQYNIGEKPTVILYAYINRHAVTPEKQRRQKST